MTRQLLALAFLSALIIAALPSCAQPPADEAWLTVTVLKSDGTPVKKPTLEVFQTDGTQVWDANIVTHGNTLSVTGLTAGDYRLTLTVPADAAFNTGRQSSGIDDVSDTRLITLALGANTLDWRLPAPASLTMKVTTAEGKDFLKPATYLFFRTGDKERVDPGDEKVAGNVATATDLLPGSYQIVLCLESEICLDVKEVTLKPGANTLDWTLPPAANAVFHLRLADGTPMSAANVAVILYRGWLCMGDAEMCTPEPGRDAVFTDISAGEYTASINGDNGIVATRPVTLKPGDNTVDWTLPPVGTLTLNLLTHNGASPGALSPELKLTRVSDGAQLSGQYQMSDHSVRLIYTMIAPGVYHATVSSRTLGAMDERDLTIVPGEQTVEWRMPAWPSVSGTLTAGGVPATPTQVIAVAYAKQYQQAISPLPVTVAGSRYTITEVPPMGALQLALLTDAGWAIASIDVPKDAGSVEAPLALQPGGALILEGQPAWKGEGGTMTPGVIVLTCTDAGSSDPPLSITADERGTVAVPSLPPGHWHYESAVSFGIIYVKGDVAIVAGGAQTIKCTPVMGPIY